MPLGGRGARVVGADVGAAPRARQQAAAALAPLRHQPAATHPRVPQGEARLLDTARTLARGDGNVLNR